MYEPYIVLDIETYRTRNPAIHEAIALEALHATPSRNDAKAVKDCWNSLEGRVRRINEAINKTACDPLLAEPLVICLGRSSFVHEDFVCMREDFVYEAMHRLADCINRKCNRDTVWVGHNIERFDLPLLVTWWQRLQIEIPSAFPVAMPGGRWRGRVFDTMTRMPTKAGYISADKACQVFGIPCKTVMWQGEPMTGARVGAAYEAGEHDLIVRYCRQDVDAETELFCRLTQSVKWGLWDRSDTITEQLREIAESDLTPAQKWLSASPLLAAAGLLYKGDCHQ